MTNNSRSRPDQGQSLTEFALVIPIFMILVVGVFDLGHVVWANASLSHAANEGARYAISRGGSRTSTCPVGPPAATAVIPVASSSCPYPSPSRQGIVNTVSQGAIAIGSTVNITVCYGTGCTGNVDAAGATNERGTPVTVGVSSNVPLITGTLLGLGTFTLSAQSTMIVSH